MYGKHRNVYAFQLFFLVIHFATLGKKTPKHEVMSTPSLSLPATQQRPMFSFNELYESPLATPSLLDGLSSSSGNPASSPSTPFDGSLLSPANISFSDGNRTGAFIGQRGHEIDAYNKLMYRCRQMEQELIKERREHSMLKDVFLFLILHHSPSCC